MLLLSAFPPRAVIAICCAGSALLSACDVRPGPSPSSPLPVEPGPVPKPRSPGEAGASAVSTVASALPAHSALAATTAAAMDQGQVRIPYVTRPGEPGLDILQQYVGKYPQDAGNYLVKGPLASRLKSLLGREYATLLRNLGTSGPLTQEGELLSLVGLRPHEGGSEAAAMVLDPARNGLRVWLLHAGQTTVYTDVDGPEIAWPPEVQNTMAAQLPNLQQPKTLKSGQM